MDKKTLKVVVRTLLRTHLYVGKKRWTEGNWFYRDHETGKLFLVPAMKIGTSIIVVGWDSGVLVAGRSIGLDTKDRNHAIGCEVETVIDEMGDFMSAAEIRQGKRL